MKCLKRDRMGFAANFFKIIAVIVIIILIGSLAFMVAQARGNPFVEKKYVETRVQLAPKYTGGIGIHNIDHQVVEQSYAETFGFWDFLDPTNVKGNIEVTLFVKEGGSWDQFEKTSKKFDVSITDGWEGTYEMEELGPLPDDSSSYKLEVRVIRNDGKLIDMETVTGTV